MSMQGGEQTSGQMAPSDVLKVELEVLRRSHRDLDARILALETGPAPDAMEVRRLKRRKLALKDEIARIEDRLYPDILA